VLTCATNTYPVASDGTYTLTFCVPTNRACYVRAMQQEGSSVSKVLTDVLDVGGAAVTGVTTLTTTGGVEIVSTVQALEANAMRKTVYDTNGDDTVDHAQSADTAADAAYATAAGTAGYSDNSGALGGQPPTYYAGTNVTDSLQGQINAIGAVSRTVYLPLPILNAGALVTGLAPNCGNPSIFVPKFSAAQYVGLNYQIDLFTTNVMFRVIANNTSETNTGYYLYMTMYAYKNGGGAVAYNSMGFTNATSTNILTYNYAIPTNVWTSQNNVQIRIGIASNAAFSSIPTGGVFVVESVATLEAGK
jgi:hypothetical protein